MPRREPKVHGDARPSLLQPLLRAPSRPRDGGGSLRRRLRHRRPRLRRRLGEVRLDPLRRAADRAPHQVRSRVQPSLFEQPGGADEDHEREREDDERDHPLGRERPRRLGRGAAEEPEPGGSDGASSARGVPQILVLLVVVFVVEAAAREEEAAAAAVAAAAAAAARGGLRRRGGARRVRRVPSARGVRGIIRIRARRARRRPSESSVLSLSLSLSFRLDPGPRDERRKPSVSLRVRLRSAFTARTGSYGKQSHLQGPWTLVRLHQHLSRVHPRRVERAQRELVIRRRAIVQRHAVPDAVKHEVEERPEVHLYERTSGWSSKASGVELKGVEVRRD
eukprot:29643-Pelagococcus_subviridis.AAC.1